MEVVLIIEKRVPWNFLEESKSQDNNVTTNHMGDKLKYELECKP